MVGQPPFPELQALVRSATGAYPEAVGESFNLHYATANSFIKVTRPWVRKERFFTEVTVALALAERNFPVAAPLFPKPLSCQDEEGKTRWVTFWERLSPHGALSPEEGTRLSAHWMLELWKEKPPPQVSTFQLDDFVHALHVRLDGHSSLLAPRLMAAVEEAVESSRQLPPTATGFIHGDLHRDNLMLTNRGVMLIDWESSCRGPLEWDAAQNLRFTPLPLRAAQEKFWTAQAVNMDVVNFYRRMRSLSSLSHFVASGIKPPMYYRALDDLGWN